MCGDSPLAVRFARACADALLDVSVVGQRIDALDVLRGKGVATVYGDPAHRAVLTAAGVATAYAVVVAADDLAATMRICRAVRELNPRAVLIAPAHNEADREWLAQFGVNTIVDASDQIASALLDAVRRVL